jgi:hypothetical protein
MKATSKSASAPPQLTTNIKNAGSRARRLLVTGW